MIEPHKKVLTETMCHINMNCAEDRLKKAKDVSDIVQKSMLIEDAIGFLRDALKQLKGENK